MQQFNIYATSVAQNVTLKNMGITDDSENFKIKEALNNSGMLSRVESLPYGIYSQMTTEFDAEGFCPSGGQKQRLALSRVYYDDRRTVLLDEFSSALDSYAEYHMTKQILDLSEDKIIIIISHRLTMTKQADKIFVFDNGSIAEQGEHEQLMKKNGLYAKFYNIQKEKYE
jgi:ATP-binding cassette subfamily B protein